MGGTVSRFSINDHVGTVLRFVLMALAARGWPLRSAGRRALGGPRWACISALTAFEAYSWLVRLVRPPGRRLALSRGVCHVLEEGPTAEGVHRLPPVVLVHGFMGSHRYFEGLAIALRAAGRKVIRHDNYGRGFSSSGTGPFTASLFVDQIQEMLDQLGLDQVDLVGYSMGGAIALAFAAAHPERTRTLALLAPAGMKSCKLPRGATLVTRIPGIDLLIGLVVLSSMMNKSSYGGDWELTGAGSQARLDGLHAADMRRLWVEGFQLPHAAGRTLARFPLGGLTEEARSLGAHKVPTLAIWGPHDALVPIKGLDELKELVPQLESHIFPTAAHAFPLERPEDTADVLQRFWSKA